MVSTLDKEAILIEFREKKLQILSKYKGFAAVVSYFFDINDQTHFLTGDCLGEINVRNLQSEVNFIFRTNLPLLLAEISIKIKLSESCN